MSSYSNIRRNSYKRVITVITGLAVNCMLGFITYRLGLPLYLDTAGTIGVTLIAGSFPGIATGVLTNVICGIFNPNAAYYSVISALIAVITAMFQYSYEAGRQRVRAVYILILGLISGGLGTVIQFMLLGRAQFDVVVETAERSGSSGPVEFFIAMLINIGINLIDKLFCAILAVIVVSRIPNALKTKIRNSGWRQRPLSYEESKALFKKTNRKSLSVRVGAVLVLTTLILAVSISWVSIRLYHDSIKAEYAENAHDAARLASMIIDADKIDKYIAEGKSVPGYKDIEEMLYGIRENSQGVKYLYVVQIRDDGCYVAFDLETADTEASAPGDKVDFEKAFYPYLPALFAGEEIPPIESDDRFGWLLTSYYPVKDASGNTVCYVGADVSMVYLSDYVKKFLVKTMLIITGILVLIIGYGYWLARYYLVYPIGSMTECTRNFVTNAEDREAFDNNVSSIRKLDIFTNDEVEELYTAICKMSVDMTDQIRNISRLADTTSKMQNGLIMTMANMVENRDSDTGEHIQKTAEYVKIILDGLKKKGYYTEKLTDKFMSDVVMSAPLHDVGKISISDIILNKPGKLSEEEFEIMKTHTTAGKEIIEKAISTVEGESYLKEARYMAAYHHERWDGNGYPEGLHGEAIPLSARIMAVADVFDALASKRVYKPAFPLDKVIEILKESSGTQFDPKCVEVFLEDIDLVKEVLEKYKGTGD